MIELLVLSFFPYMKCCYCWLLRRRLWNQWKMLEICNTLQLYGWCSAVGKVEMPLTLKPEVACERALLSVLMHLKCRYFVWTFSCAAYKLVVMVGRLQFCFVACHRHFHVNYFPDQQMPVYILFLLVLFAGVLGIKYQCAGPRTVASSAASLRSLFLNHSLSLLLTSLNLLELLSSLSIILDPMAK